MPKVEVTAMGLVVRRWFRRRLLPWHDLDRVELKERQHIVGRNPRLQLVRRGGGFSLRGRTDPGRVWYGEVVAVLRSGRRVRLRHSFSQFRGEDKALKEWAEELQRRLADSS